MNRKNLIALLGGIVLGVAGAQTFFYFRDRLPYAPALPPVKPAFVAAFDDEFRALLAKLRAAGETDADLANLVVAEFDRQLESKPEIKRRRFGAYGSGHTPELEVGRQEAIVTLLGLATFSAWYQDAVLRGLRPDELGLNDAQAAEMFDAWERWNRGSCYYDAKLPITNLEDRKRWGDRLIAQTRLLNAHDNSLRRLLGRERFAQHIIIRSPLAWDIVGRDGQERDWLAQEELYRIRMRGLERVLRYAQKYDLYLTPNLLKEADKTDWQRFREWAGNCLREVYVP